MKITAPKSVDELPKFILPIYQRLEKKIRSWETLPLRQRKRHLLAGFFLFFVGVIGWMFISINYLDLKPIAYKKRPDPGFVRKKLPVILDSLKNGKVSKIDTTKF